MGKIVEFKDVPLNTPEELKDQADVIRKLADRIESGEVRGIAWVEYRVQDKYFTSWVKVAGLSKPALIGAVGVLHHELCDSTKDDY